MYEHVEYESPDFDAPVGPVNEHAVGGERAVHGHTSTAHSVVVQETPNLETRDKRVRRILPFVEICSTLFSTITALLNRHKYAKIHYQRYMKTGFKLS